MSEDPVEKIVRDYQDRITRGVYQGICGLDDSSLDRVMECQAEECVRAFADLYQVSEELDLDAFLEKMKLGGSSKVEIERDGNTIIWKELHGGQCMCPLVTRKVIPLQSGLCRCATHWLRMLVERHVREPVRVELLDSPLRGGPNCVFRIEIDDISPPQR